MNTFFPINYTKLILLNSIFLCLIDIAIGQQIKLVNKIQIGKNDTLHFNLLEGVRADDKGNIYLIDRKKVKIYKYNQQNELLNRTGRIGRGPGEYLRGPDTITLYEDTLLVFDFSAAHVAHLYNTKGLTYQTTFHIRYSSSSAIDGKDRILMYYHDYINNTYLHVFNMNKHKLKNIHLDGLSKYPKLNKFKIYSLPRKQRFIIVYMHYNRIDILDENFNLIREISLPGLPAKSPVHKPEWTDRVISQFEGKRKKIVELASYIPENTIIKGAAVGDQGNIFLQVGTVKKAGKRKVYVITLNGNIITTFQLPFNETLVFIGSNNCLYTIKNTLNKAYRYKIKFISN